ncbi:magnesium transporter [Dinoroseobacter sp. S375]|uniref:magnesium transporter n=1 Tax=Dinoroseobacter sp. S375 TaxID=3415136 RepID=UPI003C79773E
MADGPQLIEEMQEEDYALDRDVVTTLYDALDADDPALVAEILEPMHPADIADLFEQIGSQRLRALLEIWTSDEVGAVLSELDEGLREEVIDALPKTVLADAVRDLESDDVVDLLEDLDAEQQSAILDVLEAPDRVAVEQSLQYPEYSAGRLMQRELVMTPEHWTVGQAIDHIRAEEDLPEQFYHIILVDPRMRPTAYVTLGRMLGARREVPLLDLTEDTFRTIPVTQPESDVAYAFNQYHLISAPVVDADDRLVGVITIDDAMVVLDEEHNEDILRLAGVGDESVSDTTWDITKQRFPWLGVNLLTAIIASLVISLFEDVISQVVALAVLMPIVASMGGNAGTQSLTVAVRAIATKDLTGSNAWRVLRREVMASTLNGVVFAAVMGAVSLVWFGTPVLALVIAVAMIVNLAVAGFAGLLIPLALDKLGIDPALASGTFVTTVTDVVGFFVFLGFASMILL